MSSRIRGRGRGRGSERWRCKGPHRTSSETEQRVDLKRPHQDRDPLAALACSDPGQSRLTADGDVMEKRLSFSQTDFVCLLSESDKDESVQQTQTGLTVAPKSVTSALGSLMSSYGGDMTSSESEGDADGMSLMFTAQCQHYSSCQVQINNIYIKYLRTYFVLQYVIM